MCVDLPQLGKAAISVSGPAADYTDSGVPVFPKELKSAADRLAETYRDASQYSPPLPTVSAGSAR